MAPKPEQHSTLRTIAQYVLQALLVSAILGLVTSSVNVQTRVSVIESQIFSKEDRLKIIQDTTRLVTLIDELQRRRVEVDGALHKLETDVNTLQVQIGYLSEK